MALTVESSTDGGKHATVVVAGDLDFETAPQLRTAAMRVFGEGCTTVDVDLSGLDFVDSSGLGTLVGLHRDIEAAKGTFRLVGPSARTLRLLELAKLTGYFTIRD